MIMNKINIVIIDSGVYTEHPSIKSDNINILSLKNGVISADLIQGQDTFGHGTAVYNIIRKCGDVGNIINFKIYDIENGISDDQLIFALDYIYENIDVQIINISLGVDICNNYEQFKNTCEKFDEKGIIIVSAFDNNGAISYPAAFESVIGVTSSEKCIKNDNVEYFDDSVVNIAGNGNIQRLSWVSPNYIILSGNSFACAHVSLKVVNLYNNLIKKSSVINRNSVLDELKKHSINFKKEILSTQNYKNKFNIEKAVIFPFNKETHSFIRYQDLVPFEIVDIYDIKYSANIGVSTNKLLNINKEEYIIKNISQIDWNSFDTIILGHMDKFSDKLKTANYKESLIHECIKNQKNIYSFDDISYTTQNLNYDKVYYPKITNSELPVYRQGKLYRISSPVLGVFGTSSKQGKFSLQLELRKLLQQQGYNIGQIGTEPSSLLFDMDYIFPMGYNSSVHIKEYDIVRYINNLMNNMCIDNKDIIIVGSQSGTIPYDFGNISLYTISQYNFLMASQPDAVILCINPYDNMSYISRTINFIESSVDCKVIALVLYPLEYKNTWSGLYGDKEIISDDKYLSLKEQLYKNFKIPIYKLGSDIDISLLKDEIIDCFTQEGGNI